MQRYPQMYYTTKEAFDAYGERQRKEVDTNYEIFQTKHLPELLKTHRYQFALLRHGEVVEIFDNDRLAYEAGCNRFEDFIFSTQQITDEPMNCPAFIPS